VSIRLLGLGPDGAGGGLGGGHNCSYLPSPDEWYDSGEGYFLPFGQSLFGFGCPQGYLPWWGGGGGATSFDHRKQGDVECDAAVLSAMWSAWSKSSNGKGPEYGFALAGTPQDFNIVALPMGTPGACQITFTPPAGSFALFHVHPSNCSPEPSALDKSVANQDNLLMFPESSQGLREYNPADKGTSELASLLNWTKSWPPAPKPHEILEGLP
jgi:hypothetical protein